ncbi:FIST signal transduction protein [Cryptosporangium sp. NPDC051539]|uniref:FIST signal transduction protein n=1 Tax=Cryptosporangium sp. NPDC051539 TaxID=3363962 RepID=UPI0037A99125
MGDPARWFGVGSSDAADGACAGRAAAAAALDGREAALVVVLSQVRDDLQAMLDGVRSQVPAGAIIVGTSTSGQYTAGTLDTASTVVAAYGGPGIEARYRIADVSRGRGREAAAEVAACTSELTLPYQALLLFFDGLADDQQELIRGAYAAAGAATPLVGGSSGDGLQYVRTYQFAGDADHVDVVSDAVVGVGLACESPLGIGVAHGWRQAGAPMSVTRSVHGKVFELDEQPALDVYVERLGMSPEVARDEQVFRELAFRYPLGLNRRSGEDIRLIHGGEPDDRSLICLADVPQGGLVWLMEADEDALVAAAGTSCHQAIAMLEGAPPLGMLAFDCAARKMMLGPAGVERETGALAAAAGSIPYAGWYTDGEVARIRGSQGLHHLTMVTLALS